MHSLGETAARPSFMGRYWFIWAALLLGVWSPLAHAQDQQVPELLTHPPQMEVAGQNLKRNGAGIRYKAIFKVYSAALYTEHPVASLEEVSKLSGPKRVTVSMLRGISASELGKLFAHGMQDNMDKQQFSKLIPGVMRMSDVFNRNKDLRAGDKFTLDWIPGKGMVISVNGIAEPAEFIEPEFYQAMLGIWLGPNPADSRLKAALLGGSLAS